MQWLGTTKYTIFLILLSFQNLRHLINVFTKNNNETVHLNVILWFFKIRWVQENQGVTFLLVPPKDGLALHWGQNHLPTDISSTSGMRHPMCQPWEHWSQINIIVVFENCPHNILHRPTKTLAKDGSIWPFTWGTWHGAWLCTWSFHVWPS